VTRSQRYLAGLAFVGLGSAAVIPVVSAEARDEVTWGLVIAMAIQAPLGWWTLRSIARPGFQLVWSLGMLVRFLVVGVAALVLVPAFGWQAGPALGSLVAAMMALLMVEVITAARDHDAIQ
jgi:hypothetical protein